MTEKEKLKLGKFISLVLRHKPESAYVSLDANGWVNVKELIAGIRKSGRNITMSDLEEIVETDAKNRYSFDKYKNRIRANQGHSIKVDVELKKMDPPDVLYHGTAKKTLDNIYKEGIKPMNRLYVHLSKDYETAMKVGSRHGKPVILLIDSKQMKNDGVEFYLSENGVWLTSFVDRKYFKEVNYA